MNHNEAPIIVGLDIGTTKIAAIAGRKNEFGKLEILGFGRANSSGVLHGQVLNIDQTIKAIQAALENCAQSNPDLEINEVYVGIAGHHIKSLQTRGDIVRQDADIEISRAEVEQLINNQRKTFIPAGDQIIDVIAQDFHVDSNQNIKDPVGYNGVKMGANFHPPRAADKTSRGEEAVPLETFRIAVGRRHGVQAGQIVGAIANEAGLESRYIGRIRIEDDHSLVDLPEGMPRDVMEHLGGVWVAGQRLRIRRLADDGEQKSGGNKKPAGRPGKPRPKDHKSKAKG